MPYQNGAPLQTSLRTPAAPHSCFSLCPWSEPSSRGCQGEHTRLLQQCSTLVLENLLYMELKDTWISSSSLISYCPHSLGVWAGLPTALDGGGREVKSSSRGKQRGPEVAWEPWAVHQASRWWLPTVWSSSGRAASLCFCLRFEKSLKLSISALQRNGLRIKNKCKC